MARWPGRLALLVVAGLGVATAATAGPSGRVSSLAWVDKAKAADADVVSALAKEQKARTLVEDFDFGRAAPLLEQSTVRLATAMALDAQLLWVLPPRSPALTAAEEAHTAAIEASVDDGTVLSAVEHAEGATGEQEAVARKGALSVLERAIREKKVALDELGRLIAAAPKPTKTTPTATTPTASANRCDNKYRGLRPGFVYVTIECNFVASKLDIAVAGHTIASVFVGDTTDTCNAQGAQIACSLNLAHQSPGNPNALGLPLYWQFAQGDPSYNSPCGVGFVVTFSNGGAVVYSTSGVAATNDSGDCP